MAQNNNFTRSNVNAKSLILTDPNRSSFDLSRKSNMTIPFGRIVPVGCDFLLPTDTFSGSVTPEFQFEKIATPSIGPTRLDTHTFLVNARRINNKLKQNVEQEKPFFPRVDYDSIWRLIGLLFRGGDLNKHALLNNSIYSAVSITWDYSNTVGAKNDFSWFPDFVYASYLRVRGYANRIATGELNGTPYYQVDKIRQFADYILAFWQANHNEGPQRDTIFVEFWFYVLDYFIGRSTLFDYLGYPIVTEYCESFLSWTNRKRPQILGDKAYHEYMQQLSTILTSSAAPDPALVKKTELGNMAFGLFTPGNVDTPLDYPLDRLTEGPLRAYYAVWYDYLRNFHIELRSNVLDPDLFDNENVVRLNSATPIDISRFICAGLSFYTLQYRTYNTDFLTSIQTEDVYRHVYSPILSGSTQLVYPNTTNIDSVQSLINNVSVLDLSDAAISTFFPGGNSLSANQNNESEYAALMSDLQTMRRAGMLEKWLARNYYFPDTYVGRIQARFGINPSDTNYLVSQYIGGSEKFISGDQNVANITVGDSVVGQRNLVANVSDSNTFSGSVSDYTFLVSLVSLVPIVSYDIINPALFMSEFTDIPSPEYASDSRVEARTSDFLRGFVRKPFIGYVPRYYNFRVHGDETHGRYLTDYRSYSWFRDWYSMNISGNEFSLNPYSLRVHLPLDAFLGLNDWDDVCFGTCSIGLSINRPLPAAIEVF